MISINSDQVGKLTFPISGISLDGGAFDWYQFDSPKIEGSEKQLSGLNQVNLFVGANNCGKSRCLRQLASIKSYVFSGDEERLPSSVCAKFLAAFPHLNDAKHYGLESIIKDAEGIVAGGRWLSESKDPIDIVEAWLARFFDAKVSGGMINYAGYGIEGSVQQFESVPMANAVEDVRAKIRFDLDRLAASTKWPTQFKRIYVPILRGLRSLDTDNDWYANVTATDYFNGVDRKSIEVFTGQQFRQEMVSLLLGDKRQRQLASAFQEFVGQNFFDRQEFVLIPKADSSKVYVKLGREVERPLHELGDGVQAIILLTFPIFREMGNGKNTFIFFEEPENHLHPGLQRAFMETLVHPNFQGFRFFISTHSNHFLDLTLDHNKISIYKFAKNRVDDKGDEITVPIDVQLASSGDSSTLELLGTRNTSVFFSNCTIWVEGITDRRFMASWLRLYQERLAQDLPDSFQSFGEDLNYSFVEYSGSNITHWSFLDAEDAINVERLCGRLFLISDRDGPNKIERHDKLARRLGERFYCLKGREIENLVSISQLKKFLQGLGEDIGFLDAVNEADYENVPMGRYIDEKLGDARGRDYGQGSRGTIKDKVRFCSGVIQATENFDDLSEEAKGLAIRLYRFIAQCNGICAHQMTSGAGE